MDQESPADKYPRVTQAQLELWLADPITQKYLKCFEFAAKTIDANMATGAFIHMSDPNITHTSSHGALGQRAAYIEAGKAESFLSSFGMLEDKEAKEPENEN